ncbi:Bardet-Biedl syndrome 1 protein [Armadillidium vulgare]|nr:Bardet-Biedl syndrome 1 protein [Armadillidium vulgare]
MAERSTLLFLYLKDGGLDILLLKRTAKFEPDTKETIAASAAQKLSIPKKTKLFVDQTMRERDNAILMHRVFQHDLYRLRLNTARSYVQALESSSNPVSLTQEEPLKLSAQVLGLGPTFLLRVELQNTSPTNPSLHLFVVFFCDDTVYDIQSPYIQVPMLVPGVPHIVETLITCVSELGVSDTVRVFVLKEQNAKPILSAMINMPVAEIYNEG